MAKKFKLEKLEDRIAPCSYNPCGGGSHHSNHGSHHSDHGSHHTDHGSHKSDHGSHKSHHGSKHC